MPKSPPKNIRASAPLCEDFPATATCHHADAEGFCTHPDASYGIQCHRPCEAYAPPRGTTVTSSPAARACRLPEGAAPSAPLPAAPTLRVFVPSCETSPAPSAPLPPAPAITLPALSPGLDRAGRVAYYHRLSREAGRASIMAAVAAGVELHRAKLECGHGPFTAWLKRHCDFSDRTAYRYMALAESVAGGAAMAQMLEAAEPPAIEALAEITEPIEAKTLTQLYHDLGICRPGKVGGARPGAGRPTKEPDANAAEKEALMLANKLVGDLSLWVLGDDGFGALPDDVLQQSLTMLGDIVKRGRDILSGRKAAAKAPSQRRSAAQ